MHDNYALSLKTFNVVYLKETLLVIDFFRRFENINNTRYPPLMIFLNDQLRVFCEIQVWQYFHHILFIFLKNKISYRIHYTIKTMKGRKKTASARKDLFQSLSLGVCDHMLEKYLYSQI